MLGHLVGDPAEAGARCALGWLPSRRWRALPWFSWGAVRNLDGRLRPHHAVIEFGGGGSTLYFSSGAKCVVTIETDAGWRAALTKVIPSNVTLVETPPEGRNAAAPRLDGTASPTFGCRAAMLRPVACYFGGANSATSASCRYCRTPTS